MANTVYTESVVTLNASQAEATMNALKSSAEELRKKFLEATKLGNTEDAKKYQKELDNVKKAMNGITRETKDYSEIMKNLNGSTMNELTKAAKGLSNQLKNLVPGTKEFIEKSKQLKEVRGRMDEVNKSVKSMNKTIDQLKGLLPKLGIATVFAAAAKAVGKFAKDAVSQTQLVGDQWAQFTHGMRNAYNTFVADLTSGKGWKELIENMRESYRVGKEVAAMLDELDERKWSLTLKESEYNVEIERNKQLMRDQTLSEQERLDAADEAMRLEKELADEKKQIAAQEAEARKMELQDRTKMSDAELAAYIAGYNQNRDIIQQAQQYQEELEKAESNVRALQRAYNNGAGPAAYQMYQDAKAKLKEIQDSTDETVKQWAEIDAKYQLSNNELVNNYVQALAKMNNADEEYYRSTTRMNSTASSLRKELSQEHLQAAENAYKAEVEAADRHQKELELLAKQAYAEGQISEKEYQSRIAAIQEDGLKNKLAIAERYKKDILDIQSQLLDLTVKQQEEFRRVLEESEADAARVLEVLMNESEGEIGDIMSEVDSDFENQINNLLDLMNQAADIKDGIDPSSALTAQFETEMASLQDMYDSKLLTEEEFQKAKQDLIRRYEQENLALALEPYIRGIKKVQEYLESAEQAVSALQEASMARLEARMQAELSAAGDNAEAREEIEAKYEQKKLDTQKKYAVADMVVNIAKTVAAGALAVMQALAQLGPVAGGAFAALIGITTAAQVATIVAQKNAIMNTTASSSGGGSSSVASRVPTGFSKGGYTGSAANDYQEVGVVHANEWVAPAAMVRANPIVFRKLERARKAGTPVSGVAGFADGGMTSGASDFAPAVSTVDAGLVGELNEMLRHIVENGIPAYVLLSDINSKQALQQEVKSITSKK